MGSANEYGDYCSFSVCFGSEATARLVPGHPIPYWMILLQDWASHAIIYPIRLSSHVTLCMSSLLLALDPLCSLCMTAFVYDTLQFMFV